MDKNPAVTPPSSRRFSIVDIATCTVIVVIVIVLGKTLFEQLSLRHEVSNAKAVASQLITDIHSQNGTNAHSLGDSNFKAGHSPTELTALFKSAQPSTTGKTSIDKQIVSNNKLADTVTFVYKYSNKTPFYISIVVSKPKQHGSIWEIYSISGGPSETDLLK